MSTGRIRCWVDSMRAFIAAMKASGLFGRGSKLMREDRASEAVDVLQQALVLLGPHRTGLEDPPNFSTRISVVTLLAQAAARAGDHELATESVREGMALWAETKLAVPKLRTNAMLVRWEEWARAYTAWRESEGKH